MATDLYEISGLCVDAEYMVMGVLANNVYIVSDGEGTMVVDPSCSVDKILAALGDRKLDAIVLTHSHFDHTGAAAELREATEYYLAQANAASKEVARGDDGVMLPGDFADLSVHAGDGYQTLAELTLLSPVKAMKMPVVPVAPMNLLLSSFFTRTVEPSKQGMVSASV